MQPGSKGKELVDCATGWALIQGNLQMDKGLIKATLYKLQEQEGIDFKGSVHHQQLRRRFLADNRGYAEETGPTHNQHAISIINHHTLRVILRSKAEHMWEPPEYKDAHL